MTNGASGTQISPGKRRLTAGCDHVDETPSRRNAAGLKLAGVLGSTPTNGIVEKRGPPHWIFRPTTLEATPSATTYTRTSPVPARLFGIEMFTWSSPAYAATGPA